ncbi:hypothetical protein IE077_003097, partial [Cardiosporidium cionae]
MLSHNIALSMASPDRSSELYPEAHAEINFYPSQEGADVVAQAAAEAGGFGKTRPRHLKDDQRASHDEDSSMGTLTQFSSFASLNDTFTSDPFPSGIGLPSRVESQPFMNEESTPKRISPMLESEPESSSIKNPAVLIEQERSSLLLSRDSHQQGLRAISSAHVDTEKAKLHLHPEVLQRQVDAHRAKFPRHLLLKLLDSYSVDTSAYYLGENSGKGNRSQSSPRTKNSLNADATTQSARTGDNQSFLLPAVVTGGPSLPDSESIEEIEREPQVLCDSSQFQKEDTLIWCHQQITFAERSESVDHEMLQRRKEKRHLHFHELVLADAPTTMSQFTGTMESRDADRLVPPEELDEILTVLACAAKVYITEIMAVAQSLELAERQRKNSYSPRMVDELPLHRESGKRKPGSSRSSHPSSNRLDDSEMILLQNHIYEA